MRENQLKILVCVLTCSETQKQADACLNTWVKDIESPHKYFFYGDSAQSTSMKNTWDCSPDLGEDRARLPEKTYKMLKQSLSYDWDFLFKCDDDTFLVFRKLVRFLENFNSKKEIYLGTTIGLEWQKKDPTIKKPLPYAQGGAGYILSRSAAIKCLNSLKLFYDNQIKNKEMEDYSVSLALNMEKINMMHTDNLSSVSVSNRENQSLCIDSIIIDGKITTHHVKPETMKQLYSLI